jgi:hypothetical protein
VHCRSASATTLAVFFTMFGLAGCGIGPAPAVMPCANNVCPRDLSLQARLLGLQFCSIHHRHKWTETGVITGDGPAIPDTVFAGPDGQPQRISREQCQQENDRSLAAEEDAFQRTMADAQRATQNAQQKQQEAEAKIEADELARGYQHVTVQNLIIDGRTYESSRAKVSVSGFYKLNGRRDERLYTSYGDVMMHLYQPTDARYVGLITDGGSHALRAYLMQCGDRVGCDVTILGHVSPCVETNAFGTSSSDVCLVAEELRSASN